MQPKAVLCVATTSPNGSLTTKVVIGANGSYRDLCSEITPKRGISGTMLKQLTFGFAGALALGAALPAANAAQTSTTVTVAA